MKFLTCLAIWWASFYDPKPKHVTLYGTGLLTAHRELPPATRLLITNLTNNKSVVVIVCGYGPAKWTKRDLDLSRQAFKQIAPLSVGVIKVKYQILGYLPNSDRNFA